MIISRTFDPAIRFCAPNGYMLKVRKFLFTILWQEFTRALPTAVPYRRTVFVAAVCKPVSSRGRHLLPTSSMLVCCGPFPTNKFKGGVASLSILAGEWFARAPTNVNADLRLPPGDPLRRRSYHARSCLPDSRVLFRRGGRIKHVETCTHAWNRRSCQGGQEEGNDVFSVERWTIKCTLKRCR